MAKKAAADRDEDDEKDADLVLEALPVLKPLDASKVTLAELAEALARISNAAEQAGNEVRMVAADRLLCCLKVGPIDEVVDALVCNVEAVVESE